MLNNGGFNSNRKVILRPELHVDQFNVNYLNVKAISDNEEETIKSITSTCILPEFYGNKLDLASRDITLVCASNFKMNETITAIRQCMYYCNFKKVKLFSCLTNREINKDLSDIELVKIDRMNNIQSYSKFMITQLNNYIDTKYILICQYDGFVVNINLWNDRFLDYDYIGAPTWHPYNTGNGGFSLRSKKLLECIANNLNVFQSAYNPEDYLICVKHKPFFERNGITYAPIDLATKFAWQEHSRTPKYKDAFGVHTRTTFKDMLTNREILK